MLYGGWGIEFGKVASPPESIEAHSNIRLYSLDEIREILSDRNMEVVKSPANYEDKKVSEDDLQLNIYAKKNNSRDCHF